MRKKLYCIQVTSAIRVIAGPGNINLRSVLNRIQRTYLISRSARGIYKRVFRIISHFILSGHTATYSRFIAALSLKNILNYTSNMKDFKFY